MRNNHRDDDDSDYDERGILKDGHTVSVKTWMRDSMPFHDGLGGAVGNKPGYVFDAHTSDAAALHRAQTRDFAKAELLNAWRGGLQDGDLFQFADRRMEVIGYSDAGKVRLADASEVDPDAVKEAAYTAYDAEVSQLWSKSFPHSGSMYEGGSCAINGARGIYKKDKDGKLICVKLFDKYDRTQPQNKTVKYKEPSDKEFELAGSLFDSEARSIKDEAYSDYQSELENAWRR